MKNDDRAAPGPNAQQQTPGERDPIKIFLSLALSTTRDPT
jgi:hypothetical protein